MQDDILSPQEIEELMKEAPLDKGTGKVVYPYDFRSPELLSKEKLKVFQILMEEFINKTKSFFSSQFKISLEAEISFIRQSVYREIQEGGQRTFLVIFNTPPLEGNSILEIKYPLIIFINQVLLGQELDKFPQFRLLTPVEEETGTFLAERFLLAFKEAFSKMINFSFNIVGIEKNPQLVFLASPDEPVILVTVKFIRKDTSCEVNFCFPYIVFNSLLPYLDFKRWFFITQRKKDKEIDKLLRSNIENIEIELVCELGLLDIDLKELINLEEGDYLYLNKSKDALVDIKIGDIKKFRGRVGMVDNKLGVKIEEIIGEE
ncbi:MAG: FliM/FliN family flagellar motor switch protein [Candidatus Omnitrophica bacterium]|nr:FliM/FliN family flagellar motor switch protein [Candidatus Omnitrophota bacterium]